MKRTSIIIPTHNGLGLVQQTVDSIRRFTDEQKTPYELIIVDNRSTDGTCEWCIRERIPFISLPYNTGFPAACNKGLRMASGDNLLLLNNDVIVSHGWLDGLLQSLYSSDEVGMVGPVTNYASGRQQVQYPFDSMDEFHRVAKELRNQPELLAEPILRLVGFCMLFKRDLYERIGELDEGFSPGHYEDDDYCLRARMNGFILLMCRSVFVHHLGSASFNRSDPSALQQLVECNRQRFMGKWQIDPAVFI
ncbi:glycosyltransferase family 2 protein [Paenibacillus sp. sptzw28]|uniref:glycosyltransferase family 2 protein n=1 Tax=Paenibacillus sp. sptzw28 TaxID=715179 RepID=UPI001C6E21AF|nr:glycosyltransferase family 2 protein [Paenibacillus sp. sptzw28]QYR23022.1 glycosyltransferase family 2 protein [Paenibacillus sp. sptzw28]